MQPLNVCQLSSTCSIEIGIVGNGSMICLIHELKSPCRLKSNLVVNEISTVPNSQGWSRCNYCVWKDSGLTFVQDARSNDNLAIIQNISLSWSLWGEFFHHDHSDRVFATRNTESSVMSSYYISRPVFYVPMITFHVGHVLIDLLEEIYFTMINTYGIVRKDSIIILDVAHPDEREVLQEKLNIFLYDIQRDMFGHLANTSFSEQLLRFKNIKILIASAGTALHNMLFMRPGSAVILFMQQEWCPWSWMYANQAVLLDIHIFILCPVNSSSSSSTFHTTRNFWKQGPRMTGRDKMVINPYHFQELLLLAKDVVFTNDYNSSDNSSNRRRKKVMQVTAMKIGEGPVTVTSDQKPLCGDGGGVDNISVGNNDKNDGNNHNSNKYHNSVNVDVDVDVDVRSFDETTVSGYVSSVKFDDMSDTEIFNIYHDNTIDTIDMDVKHSNSTSTLPSVWRFAILCELGITRYPKSVTSSMLFDSMPYISLCMRSVFARSTTDITCFEINKQLNYYTDLWMMVTLPIQWFHIWYQISPEGGKLEGSDGYVALDLRLHNGGIDIQQYAIGKRVKLTIPILSALITREEDHNKNVDDTFEYRNETLKLLEMKYSLPKVQYLPSVSIPFVFLHIDKTAGTTLREFIVESAETHGLNHFVPCHGTVHCVTVTLNNNRNDHNHNHSPEPAADPDPITTPTLSSQPTSSKDLHNVSVVAGHFFWDVWKDLPNFHGDDVPACFVMLRHPVVRAISYYYQRCYDSDTCITYGKMLNEISPQELEMFVVASRNANYMADNVTMMVTDEGLEDAACRVMSNERQTSGIIIKPPPFQLPIPPPLPSYAIPVALNNIEKCVVGLLEKWELTKRMLKFWYPWMDLHRDRKKMSLYKGKETLESLRPDLKEVIERYNRCDMQLYEKALEIFLKQKEIIENNAYIG
eukprot:gene2467-4787_t